MKNIDYTARLEKWYVYNNHIYCDLHDDLRGGCYPDIVISMAKMKSRLCDFEENCMIETETTRYLLGKRAEDE